MVNNFYIYCVDRDFGPFFLKFCSYFPYNAKLCLNGHEWLKRQLKHRGIGFEALDNGVLSCDDPKRAQALSDALSAEKIDALLRKWLRRLPHPRAVQRSLHELDRLQCSDAADSEAISCVGDILGTIEAQNVGRE